MKDSATNETIQELESPFINLTSFKQRAIPSASNSENAMAVKRPFRSVYELEGFEQGYDTDNEALVELMNELYDEEFDGFLQEMIQDTRELYENEFSQLHYGGQNNEVQVRRSLEEHFSPLLNEVDRFMDYMIGLAEEHDVLNMTDGAWDGLVDQYVPEMEASPDFENLFGGWRKKLKDKWNKAKNKLKNYAKKAKNLATKGLSHLKEKAVAFALGKIKQYAGTFLKKAIGWALDRIPEKYRALTKTLAEKLGVLKEIEMPEDNDPANTMQLELDGLVAHLLLDYDENELEMLEREFASEDEAAIDNSMNQLDLAREEFVSQLKELDQGQSVAPAIENFAPAIMMAIKMGIRFYGRDKLIGKIANPVSQLIAKYIGKEHASTLAKLLVDSGLRMFNLELTSEEEIEDGNRAIAAVVEDTVRQVAQLPEEVLQNEALLESNIIQAFETAAKANFPDALLSEETYIKRPDLREASKHKVAWKMKTYGKGKLKKVRYKKLNKEIETELTPYIADEIMTFGGVSLGKLLRDQMGIVVNRPIRVKVHLYETLPGADLFHIGRNESMISAMSDLGNRGLIQQLHPLTSVASGLLLGEPALGCRSKKKCLSRKGIAGSHRYYYLEIPGARAQIYSSPKGIQSLRKTTGLRLKFNFIKGQIQLFLFLSETDTQSIASQIRQDLLGNAVRLVAMTMEAGLKIAFKSQFTDNVMVVHPNVLPGKTSGNVLNRIPSVILSKLREKLEDWTVGKVSEYFTIQAPSFVQAGDTEADGVTLCVTMNAPSHFNVLGKLIGSKQVEIPQNLFSESGLDMNIEVKPGYHYV